MDMTDALTLAQRPHRAVHSPYVTIGAPGPAGTGDSVLFYRHFDAAGHNIAPPPGPRVVHGVHVAAFAGVAIDVGSVFKRVVVASSASQYRL